MHCSRLGLAVLVLIAAASGVAVGSEIELIMDSQEQTSMSRFLTWMRGNGAEFGHVDVSQDWHQGRRLIADNPLKPDDRIAAIPTLLTISLDTALQVGLPRAFTTIWHESGSQDDLLALFLLREKALGARSAWAPYIEILPKKLSNLLFFNDGELAQLQNEQLVEQVSQQKSELQGRFLALRQHEADIFGGKAELVLSDFLWARAIVLSRAFTIHARRYLIPFADLLNHRFHPTRGLDESGEFFYRHHDFQNGMFLLTCDRPVNENEEVEDDYGNLSNAQFLQLYGFVPESNPHECVEINLADLLHGEREALLLKSEYAFKLGIPHIVCIGATRPPSVTGALEAIAYINDLHALKLRACIDEFSPDRSPVESFSNCVQGRELNMADTVERIIVKLTSIAASFATTVAADELALQRTEDKPRLLHRRLALQYRIQRKRLVAELISTFANSFEPTAPAPSPASETVSSSVASSSSTSLPSSTPAPAPSPPSSSPSIPSVPLPSSSPAAAAATTPAPARLETSQPTAPVSSSKLQLFQAWLHEHKCRSKKIQLVDRSDEEDGQFPLAVIARSPLAEFETIARIPLGILINDETAKASLDVGELLTALDATSQQDLQAGKTADWDGSETNRLSLVLMHEYFVKRQESDYWPFLSTLPALSELNTLLSITREELGLFRQTPIFADMVQLISNIDRRFVDLSSLLGRVEKKSLFALNNTDGTTSSAWTRNNFMWANIMITTRAVWWNGRLHLMPLVDLMQRYENVDGRVGHFGLELSDDGGAVEVTSTEAIEGNGRAITASPSLANHQYLYYHGWTREPSPNDCIKLLLDVSVDPTSPRGGSSLSSADKKAKIDQLIRFGVPNGIKVFCLGLAPAIHVPASATSLKSLSTPTIDALEGYISTLEPALHFVRIQYSLGSHPRSVAVLSKFRDVVEAQLQIYRQMDL
ncbi:hypothetical protein CAOG_05107 [Capsaspora owczarzaki ATCC 30864]|uniref:hypothetical protein n=1 Tax=Capsaspora owczarzaki (strain ATCC 30864) TaxID=595528 RepID=UPI0001FE4AA6|nr:hypothetical protein CAOG_05107 [Capsaspora owczarzaki ATCC 30864]|eukprot:XP_004346792.1 hypothetical protein CAOG_05107 [Capsaspora owczarzaki ATCC 30864]